MQRWVVPRNIYADLFAEIGTTFGVGDGSTTFNLPELRGEFRGWDDGRGADAARAFGSFQADMTSSHYHTNSVATFGLAGGGSNITAFQGLTNTSDRIQTSGETRPRNVAPAGLHQVLRTSVEIYNYHPLTGEYLGRGLADDSPLDPGNPIVPGYATPNAPPTPVGRGIAFSARPPVACAELAGRRLDFDARLPRGTALSDRRRQPFRSLAEYSGIGDLPAFLTDEARPGPAHVWRDEAWQLTQWWRHSSSLVARAQRRFAGRG